MIVERLNGNKLNEGFGEEERFPSLMDAGFEQDEENEIPENKEDYKMQPGYVGADCSTEEDEDEQEYLPEKKKVKKNIMEKVIHNFQIL
jgi:hypothetical protein